MFALRSFFRIGQRSGKRTSLFDAALSRVKEMRERSTWPPATPQPAIEQRHSRVAATQRKLVYHPVEYDRFAEVPISRERICWLGERSSWLIWVPLTLLGGIIGYALLTMDRAEPATVWVGQYAYPLPSPPTFLTDELALQSAQRALSEIVEDVAQWKPVLEVTGTQAPDGTLDTHLWRDGFSVNSGQVMFESAQASNTVWNIGVVLQGSLVRCYIWRMHGASPVAPHPSL